MSDLDASLFGKNERSPDEVAIDYIKSSDFRVIWADGLLGSPTPSGHIHFVLFAERPAVPRRQVHKLDTTTGELGDAIPDKTISRGSLVREMACDVMLTPETARNMAQWLIDQVEMLEGSKRKP